MNSPSETSMVAISGQELQSLALEFEAPVDFVERLYESALEPDATTRRVESS